MYLLSLVVPILFMRQSMGAPAEMKKYMHYLVQYGYMDESGMLDKNYKMVRDGTMMFQKFVNLPLTGKMNKKTIEMMSTARCGNPDMIPASRSKRYAYFCESGRAQKRDISVTITYKINKFPMASDLDELTTKMQIRRAFSFWTRFTNITFKETNVNEDIELSFEGGKSDNGTRTSFDGPGNVLANAFPPPSRGRIRFDIEETWTLDNAKDGGVDLMQVAVHEIGHHLGLHHSNVKESVMYPYYTYNPNFDLNEDDIKGIQRLYHPNFDGFVDKSFC